MILRCHRRLRGAARVLAVGALALLAAARPALASEAPPAAGDRPGETDKDGAQARALVAGKTALLRSMLKDLREGRLRFESDLKARQRKLEDVKARKGELELKLAAEKRSAAETEEKCRRLQDKAEELRKSLEEKQAVLAECDGAIRDRAAGLVVRIREGVPFETEERVRPLAEHLKAGAAETIDAARLVARSLEYEISIGSSTSAFQGRIEIESDRPRTRYVKIGLVYMAFVTENGKEAGVLRRVSGGLGGGREWAWNADLDYLSRLRLRSAVEMAEKRKPPAIINLPVDLSSVVRAAEAGGRR